MDNQTICTVFAEIEPPGTLLFQPSRGGGLYGGLNCFNLLSEGALLQEAHLLEKNWFSQRKSARYVVPVEVITSAGKSLLRVEVILCTWLFTIANQYRLTVEWAVTVKVCVFQLPRIKFPYAFHWHRNFNNTAFRRFSFSTIPSCWETKILLNLIKRCWKRNWEIVRLD